MRQLIERLLARMGYVRAAPVLIAPARPTLEQACFEFGVREAHLRQQFANAVQAARCEAWHVGLAQGEIDGRMALVSELNDQFGIDGAETKMTRDELVRVTVRQLH